MAPNKMKTLDSANPYTIGWIAALHIERAAAAAMLDEEHAQPKGFLRNPNDKNSYTWGRIGDHNIVIASLPAGVHGLVPAGATASSLLSSLPSIRIGLLVGIGGGIPRPDDGYDIRLGDVIVSQPDGTTGGVCQYDMVKAKPGNRRERKGFLAPPPGVLLHAVASIRSDHELKDSEIPNFLEQMQTRYPKMAKQTKQRRGYVHQGFEKDRLFEPSYDHISSQQGGCESCEIAREVKRDERESTDPEIHYGIIASGNTLVKDGISRDRIVAEVGEECICFEMEAAGLMNEFPCLVIRGVCDYADSHKNDQWQRYASATAAAYAKELLLAHVPEAEVLDTKQASEILQLVDQKLDNVQQASQAVNAKVESIILGSRGQKLREWLAAPDPNTNANHARQLRHEGTGTWLLETSTFQEWMSGNNRHLWLRGMAGSGKTVLSTTILDHLAKTDDRILLRFFFDFSNTTKQTKDSLLRSIALQLYQQGSDSVKARLDESFREHKEGDVKPNTANLEELVDELLTAQQRVVIFLDALDESGTRNEIISWIKRIHENLSLVQMFYTSREEADFMRAFPSMIGEKCCLSIDKEATDTDIASYVSARLRTQPEFNRNKLSGNVLDRIRNKVGNGANGMFGWAACQLDSLAKCSSPDELEEQLDSLPLDLPDTYRRMLDSIPDKYKERSIRLLQFLAFSKRPLSLKEGIEIIATEIQGEQPCFKPGRRLFNDKDILCYCTSLVSLHTYEEEISRVQALQLAHFSVKEYLLFHVQSFNPRDASVAITKTLLTYLRDARGKPSRVNHKFPLAYYAAYAWVEFAVIAEASEDISTTIVSFLQTERTFKLWTGLRGERPCGSYFYHACTAGLKAVVMSLIDKGIDVNEGPDGYYGSPLQTASYHGHLEVVRLLLIAKADVNANGGKFGTALQAACHRGHLDVVRLLIKHEAYIDANEGEYGTALQAACHSGHLNIARLLIEHGANINMQSGKYGNALEAASYDGHIKIVELLLSFQADINAGEPFLGKSFEIACKNRELNLIRLLVDEGADLRPGTRYFDALMAACSSQMNEDRVDIVQFLFDHGAGIHVDVDDGDYECLLLEAVRYSNKKIIELLINHGADPNARVGRFGSPLHAACLTGNEEIFHLLVASGADIKAISPSDIESFLERAIMDGSMSWFRTVASLGESFIPSTAALNNLLQTACVFSHMEGIKFSVERGANINARGDKYGGALHAACARRGNGEIIQLLIEMGGDVNMNDKYGMTPLHHASRYRNEEEIVMTLLRYGSSIEAKEIDGRTPLHLASLQGHEAVVKLLLYKGSQIESHDEYGNTPLHLAAQHGYKEAAELLLKNEANIESKDNKGLTPLHIASKHWSEEVAELFLKNGANIESKDNKGLTPLHIASKHCREEVAELLIKNGANIESKDNEGLTPLHFTLREGYEEVAELLINNGANIESKDNEGLTPLHIASREGNEKMAELLLENGANVDSTNKDGLTPLDLASSFKHQQLVGLLVKNGADNRSTETN